MALSKKINSSNEEGIVIGSKNPDGFWLPAERETLNLDALESMLGGGRVSLGCGILGETSASGVRCEAVSFVEPVCK